MPIEFMRVVLNEFAGFIVQCERSAPRTFGGDFVAITLAGVAKAHLIDTWQDHFLDLVDGLVERNLDQNLLGEIFSGKTVTSVAQITQDMVGPALRATNVMGWYSAEDWHVFTIDIGFKEADLHGVFAVQFDDAGDVTSVGAESKGGIARTVRLVGLPALVDTLLIGGYLTTICACAHRFSVTTLIHVNDGVR